MPAIYCHVRICRVIYSLLAGCLALTLTSTLSAEINVLSCESSPEESALLYQRLVWITDGEHLAPSLPSRSYDSKTGIVEIDFQQPLPEAAMGCDIEGALFFDFELKKKKVMLKLQHQAEMGTTETAIVFYYPFTVEAQLMGAKSKGDLQGALLLIDEARNVGIELDMMADFEAVALLDLDKREGLEFLERGLHQEAVDLLQRVHKARPNDFDVGFGLAKAQYHLSNYGDAEKRLKKLYRQNFRNKNVLFYLGLLSLSRNKSGKAIEYLEQAVTEGAANAYFYLGAALYTEERFSEARVAFNGFFEHDGNAALEDRARAFLGRIERQAPRTSRTAAVRQPPPREISAPARETRKPAREKHAPSREVEAPPPPVADRMAAAAAIKAPPKTVVEPLVERPQPPPGKSVYGLGIQLQGFRRPHKQFGDFSGDVTVLHLWASWCLPCRDELPSLVEFYKSDYQKLKKKGFRLATLSMDYTEEALSRYVDRDQPMPTRFPIYWDPDWKVSERIDVTSIELPKTILIGRGGKILDVHIGKHDWQDPDLLNRFQEFLAEDQGN